MRAFLFNSLVLILPLTWLALLGLWYEIKLAGKFNFSKRDLIIFATLSAAILLFIFTEGLSLFRGLTRSALFIAWSIAFLMISTGYVVLAKRHYGNFRQFLSAYRARLLAVFSQKLRWYESTILWLIVLQVFILGMVAYVYPSNTWDSMVYHLARVLHWEQERSVAHYATGSIRQIQLQPFAEYVILNLQLLTSSDHLANMVQWASMVLSAIAISNIAKKLGATRDRQIISALLVVIIPTGILEATSTQNDYVVAFWLTSLFSICLGLIKEPDSVIWWLATGLSLGLALFTKATAYMFAPAILIFAFIFVFSKKKFRAVPIFIAIGIIAFLLNVGLYVRNYQTFASPLGPTTSYHNKIFTPAAVASNAIRDTVSNIPMTSENPVLKTVYQYTRAGLRLLHELTGLSPFDGRVTFDSSSEFNAFIITPIVSDEMAPNPAQVALMVMAVITFVAIPFNKRLRVFFWENRAKRLALAYAATCVLAFIFFCLYLAWQPWINRLLLPLFVLWCAVIPLAILDEHRMVFVYLAIFFGVMSFNTSFNNASRPITAEALYAVNPREGGYFTNQPDLFPIFSKLAREMKDNSCRKVGLVFGDDLYEYAAWKVFLRENPNTTFRFVQVVNTSKKYEDPSYQPCEILANKELENFGTLIGKYEYRYGKIWVYKTP